MNTPRDEEVVAWIVEESDLDTLSTAAENFKGDNLCLHKELCQYQGELEKTKKRLTSLREDHNLASLQL